jgi:hypothetical protein
MNSRVQRSCWLKLKWGHHSAEFGFGWLWRPALAIETQVTAQADGHSIPGDDGALVLRSRMKDKAENGLAQAEDDDGEDVGTMGRTRKDEDGTRTPAEAKLAG